MDIIDKGILNALQKNCRVSYEVIAKNQGISANAIKRRVVRLQKSGVINRYVVRLSWSMVGAHPLVIIVYSNRSYDDDEFMEQIGSHPLVHRVQFDSWGSAVLRASYRDGSDILQLSDFLQSIEGVNELEIHPVPWKRGEHTTLSNLQLKVLAQITKNARMPISRIASESKLTAKRVRNILLQLYESQSVLFTTDIDLSVGDGNMISFRISYQPKIIKPKDVMNPLKEEYKTEFWRGWYSSSQNLMWVDFVIDNVRDAEPISKRIRMMPGLKIENTIVPYPIRWFNGYRETRMTEILREAGLLKSSK